MKIRRKEGSMPLQPGDPAPDFTLSATAGETVGLAALKGRKVVLYFYPKDDTSGCTLEAQSFNALRGAFADAGTEVIGVSPDSLKSHDKFRAKYGLDLTLASDEGEGDASGLRRLGREEHVRSQIHGCRAHDRPHRPGREGRAGLVEGEGARARRGGARGRPTL